MMGVGRRDVHVHRETERELFGIKAGMDIILQIITDGMFWAADVKLTIPECF